MPETHYLCLQDMRLYLNNCVQKLNQMTNQMMAKLNQMTNQMMAKLNQMNHLTGTFTGHLCGNCMGIVHEMLHQGIWLAINNSLLDKGICVGIVHEMLHQGIWLAINNSLDIWLALIFGLH